MTGTSAQVPWDRTGQTQKLRSTAVSYFTAFTWEGADTTTQPANTRNSKKNPKPRYSAHLSDGAQDVAVNGIGNLWPLHTFLELHAQNLGVLSQPPGHKGAHCWILTSCRCNRVTYFSDSFYITLLTIIFPWCMSVLSLVEFVWASYFPCQTWWTKNLILKTQVTKSPGNKKLDKAPLTKAETKCDARETTDQLLALSPARRVQWMRDCCPAPIPITCQNTKQHKVFHTFPCTNKSMTYSQNTAMCVCLRDEMSVSLYLCKRSGLLQDEVPQIIYLLLNDKSQVRPSQVWSGQVKSNQAKSGQRFKVQKVCPSGVRAGNCQHTKQHKIHHTFPCTYDPRQSVHNQTTRTKSGQVTPKKSKLYVTVICSTLPLMIKATEEAVFHFSPSVYPV